MASSQVTFLTSCVISSGVLAIDSTGKGLYNWAINPSFVSDCYHLYCVLVMVTINDGWCVTSLYIILGYMKILWLF